MAATVTARECAKAGSGQLAAGGRWRPETESGAPTGGAAEELQPLPRKITRLGARWCPVPLYRLSQDYTFASPSVAAGVMLGRTATGRIELKRDALKRDALQ
jgi:hypothetical protein